MFLLSHLSHFCRVSVADERQTTDLQRDALLSAGVDERNIFEDRVSGAKDDRPGLKTCLDYLKEGDKALEILKGGLPDRGSKGK